LTGFFSPTQLQSLYPVIFQPLKNKKRKWSVGVGSMGGGGLDTTRSSVFQQPLAREASSLLLSLPSMGPWLALVSRKREMGT